jgi:TfoX/Sxy family transcriptional regulator of competence genes
VAFDEDLAHRIRELAAARHAVREQRMFGGLAFLVGGNMAIAASGQGGVLVRVDPDEGGKLIARGVAQPMEMRGRSMAGWIRVEADAVRTKRQLARWVALGTDYAASLPPKRG